MSAGHPLTIRPKAVNTRSHRPAESMPQCFAYEENVIFMGSCLSEFLAPTCRSALVRAFDVRESQDVLLQDIQPLCAALVPTDSSRRNPVPRIAVSSIRTEVSPSLDIVSSTFPGPVMSCDLSHVSCLSYSAGDALAEHLFCVRMSTCISALGRDNEKHRFPTRPGPALVWLSWSCIQCLWLSIPSPCRSSKRNLKWDS